MKQNRSECRAFFDDELFKRASGKELEFHERGSLEMLRRLLKTPADEVWKSEKVEYNIKYDKEAKIK